MNSGFVLRQSRPCPNTTRPSFWGDELSVLVFDAWPHLQTNRISNCTINAHATTQHSPRDVQTKNMKWALIKAEKNDVEAKVS